MQRNYRFLQCYGGNGGAAELVSSAGRDGYKPCLPAVIMGHIHSLSNKLERLSALMMLLQYRELNVISLMEMWLHTYAHTLDSILSLDRFPVTHVD